MDAKPAIVILGVFVADTAYRADRPPRMGETILGKSFALGPGGKGSNQAVAAARLGGETAIITRLGDDAFADLAEKTWADAGVINLAKRDPSNYTGAAYIFIEEASGDNAIIICPGAAGDISATDVEAASDVIASASVFVTQLEQPIPAAKRALEIAHAAGAATILNPAPAAPLEDGTFTLCDYVTPNETETEALTGMSVATVDEARQAADALLAKGAGAAIITLGEQGALLHAPGISELVPAFDAGPVVETTGAGDAFTGGLAVGLAQGMAPLDAVRLGCATAAISVTRPGTAPSMPTMDEVQALL
ncbi:MAG: ribokinase [Alphaproteobacteria bacterium]|nr:ribokinase [Alphaproteobacteria bacterium]